MSRREEEAKEEADAAAAASRSPGGGGGWKGGPLSPSAASMSAAISRRSTSSVLGPLERAQGTGFEISAEIDSLRAELQEIRLSNSALQQTNQELHEALAQVTERSKMLSTEHARFLDEFRNKSQIAKQKLINDRAALKLNLGNTNTRLEDLEKLNANITADKMQVVRKLEELTNEHDALSVNYANLQREKQIWLQKEQEFLDIQTLQSRNLDELNQTVLTIQEEREGWHRRWEESQNECAMLQQHASSLEHTVHTQDQTIQQLNSNLLTSQEEIINLTQTLATHLEQIANISKQNKELHATLVNFTRTNDHEYVAELLPHINAHDMTLNTHIELARSTAAISADSNTNDPHLNPSFNGPVPSHVHSNAFLSTTQNPAHPTMNPAYNFLHTTSSLSTLHLPATYLTSKLSSYILWILEHKQILENMLQRKEKLRKELEEQIVVANVEAQVAGQEQISVGAGGRGSPVQDGMRSPARSPSRSPSRNAQTLGSPTMRSSSPMNANFSPSRSAGAVTLAGGMPLPSSAVAPATLLLPSLLQHTLHDLHELTHLTQHDQLQYSNFEREKTQILGLCSSHGFEKHNTKRAKTAWNIWVAALNQRVYRKQLLVRILQRGYLRQLARSFGRMHAQVLVRYGQTKIQEKSNEVKRQVIQVMLRKSNLAADYAQQLAFQQWRSRSHRRAKLRTRFIHAFVHSAENRIGRLWTKWKANVLRLRNRASIAEGRETRKMEAVRRFISICAGHGVLGKMFSRWKVASEQRTVADLTKQLVKAKKDGHERYERQKEMMLHGYGELKERYKNFKVYHWWRLAYVDTQWMKREVQWRGALTFQRRVQLKSTLKLRLHSSFTSVFRAWRKVIRDRKAGRKQAAITVWNHLCAFQLRIVVRHWVKITEKARVEEVQEKLMESSREIERNKLGYVHSLTQKWRRHHLANAFNQLYDQVQLRKARKREALERV